MDVQPTYPNHHIKRFFNSHLIILYIHASMHEGYNSTVNMTMFTFERLLFCNFWDFGGHWPLTVLSSNMLWTLTRFLTIFLNVFLSPPALPGVPVVRFHVLQTYSLSSLKFKRVAWRSSINYISPLPITPSICRCSWAPRANQ